MAEIANGDVFISAKKINSPRKDPDGEIDPEIEEKSESLLPDFDWQRIETSLKSR